MASKVWIVLVSILLAFTLGACWYSLGVYQDREFDDYYLFIKHKPSGTFYFHSPVGESDRLLSDLNHSDYESEILYREFIEDGGGWERAIYLPGF